MPFNMPYHDKTQVHFLRRSAVFIDGCSHTVSEANSNETSCGMYRIRDKFNIQKNIEFRHSYKVSPSAVSCNICREMLNIELTIFGTHE